MDKETRQRSKDRSGLMDSFIFVDLRPIIFGAVMLVVLALLMVGYEIWRKLHLILKNKGKN